MWSWRRWKRGRRGGKRVQRYTRFRYHLVWATQGRRRLITQEVEDVLYPAIAASAKRHGGSVYVINGVEDHVHVALGVTPAIGVSEFVRKVKSESSSIVRRRFPELDFRWQRGYGGFTLDDDSCRRVITYIENQKLHHRRNTTTERLEQTSTPDGAQAPR